MSSAAAEVGSTANSYQILAKLASGGMAEIFLARGEGVAGVERYCVLKRILRDRAGDVQFVQMFLDEARLAAQLHHPNIAQVYDIGKLGDSYFFTMEYVHGETVRALLHRSQGLRRPLPIGCVLTIVAGAAAGLHHAHVRVGLDGRALGIVHRDVSPSNLMVSYEGGVKVVDFGVAKADDRAQETKSGTVKGKISYLSPEQCRGKRVDRRSDLFSLGICFWEMLTTERLYRRSSDFENMTAIVTEPPPRPSSRRPDVPPEIDELVLRLLAKRPDERFQTADDLVDAIEAAAARTGSVLSASGLGRFVRDLFGHRPEPWLELEGQHEQREAVTMAGELVPGEGARAPAERIGGQLSSVVDLSTPCSVTESLEPVQIEASTEQLGTPAEHGASRAAPPPTPPGIVPESAPAPSAGAQPAPPDTTGPSRAVARPRPEAFTPSSGQVVLPAPPVVPHAPPISSPGPWAAPPASASIAARGSPSISFSVVPRPPSAPPASLSALRGPRGAAVPRRAGWPLYAVISGAALAGSIAVMIMMRSGAAAGDAASRTLPAGPLARTTEHADTVDLRTLARGVAPRLGKAPGRPGGTAAAEHSVEVGGDVAAGRSASGGEPVAVQHSVGDGRVAAEHSVGGGGAVAVAAPVDDDLVRPAPPVLPVPPPPPGAATRVAPPRTPISAAPARASPNRAPQAGEIPHLYAQHQYDEVIEHCDGPVSAEHAPLCFLAACHLGDGATARRLITAVPAARREQLTTNCLQFGLDITKKPDCEANPMDCQH